MRVKVKDIQVNYELSGKAGAPVVMLSHSLGSSLVMWDPQMRALEPDYQVLRYDTRGHGSTDPEVREVPGTRYFFGDDERQEGQDPNWAYTIMKNL